MRLKATYGSLPDSVLYALVMPHGDRLGLSVTEKLAVGQQMRSMRIADLPRQVTWDFETTCQEILLDRSEEGDGDDRSARPSTAGEG